MREARLAHSASTLAQQTRPPHRQNPPRDGLVRRLRAGADGRPPAQAARSARRACRRPRRSAQVAPGAAWSDGSPPWWTRTAAATRPAPARPPAGSTGTLVRVERDAVGGLRPRQLHRGSKDLRSASGAARVRKRAIGDSPVVPWTCAGGRLQPGRQVPLQRAPAGANRATDGGSEPTLALVLDLGPRLRSGRGPAARSSSAPRTPPRQELRRRRSPPWADTSAPAFGAPSPAPRRSARSTMPSTTTAATLSETPGVPAAGGSPPELVRRRAGRVRHRPHAEVGPHVRSGYAVRAGRRRAPRRSSRRKPRRARSPKSAARPRCPETPGRRGDHAALHGSFRRPSATVHPLPRRRRPAHPENDGEVATATVGVDSRRGRWHAGLAMAYSVGDGLYTHATAAGGGVRSSLASVHPFRAIRDQRTGQRLGVCSATEAGN